MSEVQSRISAKIKEMQETNNRREEAARKAEEALAEGNYVSNPVVEQVMPKANGNKRKTVSVKREQPKSAQPFGETGASEQTIISDNEPVLKDPQEHAARQERPEDKAALDQRFKAMEELLGGPQAERRTIQRDIPHAEPEPTREQKRNSDPPQEKKLPSKLRGPHTVRQRTVRYVDLEGAEIRNFCIIEEATGELHRLYENNLIGKSREADITIDYSYVSRKHARITCEDGAYYIEDLDSTNGTFVNDTEIEEKTEIKPGDMITLADYNLIFDALR